MIRERFRLEKKPVDIGRQVTALFSQSEKPQLLVIDSQRGIIYTVSDGEPDPEYSLDPEFVVQEADTKEILNGAEDHPLLVLQKAIQILQNHSLVPIFFLGGDRAAFETWLGGIPVKHGFLGIPFYESSDYPENVAFIAGGFPHQDLLGVKLSVRFTVYAK